MFPFLLKLDVLRFCLLFYLLVVTFPVFKSFCAIGEGGPARPAWYSAYHYYHHNTDYEIQLIIITISWYGFFLNATDTLWEQLSLSDSKCSVKFRIFF